MKTPVMLMAMGLVIAAATTARAQRTPAPGGPALDIPRNMTQYFVVFLVKAPGRTDTELPADLLRRHLAYMRAMIEQKRYVVAGPFLDNDKLVGMAIVTAGSLEEAQGIATSDPTVMEGHFVVEVHPVNLPSLAGVVVQY